MCATPKSLQRLTRSGCAPKTGPARSRHSAQRHQERGLRTAPPSPPPAAAEFAGSAQATKGATAGAAAAGTFERQYGRAFHPGTRRAPTRDQRPLWSACLIDGKNFCAGRRSRYPSGSTRRSDRVGSLGSPAYGAAIIEPIRAKETGLKPSEGDRPVGAHSRPEDPAGVAAKP